MLTTLSYRYEVSMLTVYIYIYLALFGIMESPALQQTSKNAYFEEHFDLFIKLTQRVLGFFSNYVGTHRLLDTCNNRSFFFISIAKGILRSACSFFIYKKICIIIFKFLLNEK